MRIGQSQTLWSGGSYAIAPPAAYYLRARNVYDAVGRMVGHSQYSGFDEINAVASRSISCFDPFIHASSYGSKD